MRAANIWYHDLEQRLVPKAFQAAIHVCPHVRYVEFRPESGSVCVVVSQRLTWKQQRKVAAAVRKSLRPLVANHKRLNICVRRPFRLKYTSHLATPSQAMQLPSSLQVLSMYKVTTSEIQGLRDVYDELASRADGHDYIATTALGGIPGLLHILDAYEARNRPDDRQQWPDFFDLMRDRIHLFPGLLWSHTSSEEEQLFAWLGALPSGSSVLLFDTGTVGNGALQMRNCIAGRISNRDPFGPGRVDIVGVVDGSRPPSTESQSLAHAAGTTTVTVEYLKVPRVLTEDCQDLIGFESIRREMMYRPLQSSAVIEVCGEDGKRLHAVGAMSGASALRGMIRHGFVAHPALSDDMLMVLAGMTLQSGLSSEFQMLHRAVEGGLLDRADAASIADDAEKRAMAIFDKRAFVDWDFEGKGRRKKKRK